MSAVSLFDWTTYRNIFSTASMEAIFSERGFFERLVEVERVIAESQGELGIIPENSAKVISKRVDAGQLDLNRLHVDMLKVGRPIAGLVQQLVEQAGDEHGNWVHYGVTTYDVMDTGKALQIRDAIELILNQLKNYRQHLTNLIDLYGDKLMIGRTNNLYAQPITFGLKVASWVEEVMRHEERLHELKYRVQVVQIGGAVGTLAAFQSEGLSFRRRVAKKLELGLIQSNWHNARDSISELTLNLGNLCASLARTARNINTLSGSDIGELSETGESGRGRSTSMAHKCNPRSAEFAEAIARLGRHRATGMLEVMEQDHDRCGGTWIAEWMLIPETFLLTSSALSWANDLLERLVVHPDRMMANIESHSGLLLTERFTLALAQRIDKSDARRLLDEACARVKSGNLTLIDALSSMSSVRNILTEEEITALADPQTYLGVSREIIDNVLSAARKSE